MEMPSAKEHAKSKIEVSREFYHKVCDKILRSKSGRIMHMCSSRITSPQQKELAIRLLREKGYKISYGTEYMIVEW